MASCQLNPPVVRVADDDEDAVWPAGEAATSTHGPNDMEIDYTEECTMRYLEVCLLIRQIGNNGAE